ncbi:DUF6801 domain-containing protein [Goodfellowiella coeruleoviolacea]|uniref:DUF6801 domain-containing protein n=1 Tax=Goodfellowiella coeruleoviolacea TaxID=334858 RepID=UPI0020A42BE3|nr:DUF6801 domain-containing protein [Goodfellowiella coeruleoviolacea]
MPAPHRPRRPLAVGVVVGLVGAVVVAAGSAVAGPTTTALAYTCQVDSADPRPVTVEFAAGFPDEVRVGDQFQVTGFTATLRLPEATALTLAARGARAVHGAVRVGVSTRQHDVSQDVMLPDLVVPATPLPASGELVLAGSADLAPLAMPRPGPVTFAVGAVSVTLSLDGPEGKGTDPGAAVLSCTQDADQDATLATVVVTAAGRAPGEQRTSPPRAPTSLALSSRPASPPPSEPDGDGSGGDPRGGGDQGQPPPDGEVRPLLDLTYVMNGTSRIAKFGSEMRLGPGSMSTSINLQTGVLVGDMSLPTSASYFVNFNFVPSTSNVDMLPAARVSGIYQRGIATANSQVIIKLSDVMMGGAPLNVGPSCQTVRPASIDLTGPLQPTKGGTLTATYTIPEFAGCGTSEPLDALFTGLISGPGNTLTMTLTR